MQYPSPEDFPEDDVALLRRVLEVHRQRLAHVLGRLRLENFDMPVLDARLRSWMNEEGQRQLDLDYAQLDRTVRNGRVFPALNRHGLVGPHLRFKVACLHAADQRQYVGGRFRYVRALAMTVGGIVDKIIDSAIEATGAGTSIREVGDIASDVIGGTVDK